MSHSNQVDEHFSRKPEQTWLASCSFRVQNEFQPLEIHAVALRVLQQLLVHPAMFIPTIFFIVTRNGLVLPIWLDLIVIVILVLVLQFDGLTALKRDEQSIDKVAVET
ncbi:hypothetical protein KSS87_019734 [Heliosperma pusillum]|nr:hypothetical protein KSS87_019734 [Heliosperma pusillum]